MAGKRIIWSLAALCLVVCVSSAEAKTWLDATCSVKLESGPDRPFIVSKVDGSYRNACTIADWPISSHAAAMECEDGAKATMELRGDDVLLDGLPVSTGMSDVQNRVSLIPKGDARLSCDR